MEATLAITTVTLAVMFVTQRRLQVESATAAIVTTIAIPIPMDVTSARALSVASSALALLTPEIIETVAAAEGGGQTLGTPNTTHGRIARS